MTDEYVLKYVFEGTKPGPGKHREFFAAPMARTHFNKPYIHNLVPVSRENKRYTSILPLLN